MTRHINEEDMPLCPACDQPIFVGERIVVVRVNDSQALMHSSCADEHPECRVVTSPKLRN